MTFVTGEPTFNFTWMFTMLYPISAIVTVIQPVIQPVFSAERALPLKCWYPIDQFVSVNNLVFDSAGK